MSKLSKAESARINGAKSKGPVTPEGKAKSSRNAFTHGAYSELMVLDTEEPAAYLDLSQQMFSHFKPRNIMEEELVRDVIDGRWRLHRVKGMETAVLNLQMSLQRKEIETKFVTIDVETRTVLAATELADTSQLLPLLQRLDTKFTRLVHRTIELLAKLQSDMPPSQLTGGGPSISVATTQPAATIVEAKTSEPATEPAQPAASVMRRPHFLTPERYAAIAPRAIPHLVQENRNIDFRNEPTEVYQTPSLPAETPERLRYFQAA